MPREKELRSRIERDAADGQLRGAGEVRQAAWRGQDPLEAGTGRHAALPCRVLPCRRLESTARDWPVVGAPASALRRFRRQRRSRRDGGLAQLPPCFAGRPHAMVLEEAWPPAAVLGRGWREFPQVVDPLRGEVAGQPEELREPQLLAYAVHQPEPHQILGGPLPAFDHFDRVELPEEAGPQRSGEHTGIVVSGTGRRQWSSRFGLRTPRSIKVPTTGGDATRAVRPAIQSASPLLHA